MSINTVNINKKIFVNSNVINTRACKENQKLLNINISQIKMFLTKYSIYVFDIQQNGVKTGVLDYFDIFDKYFFDSLNTKIDINVGPNVCGDVVGHYFVCKIYNQIEIKQIFDKIIKKAKTEANEYYYYNTNVEIKKENIEEKQLQILITWELKDKIF